MFLIYAISGLFCGIIAAVTTNPFAWLESLDTIQHQLGSIKRAISLQTTLSELSDIPAKELILLSKPIMRAVRFAATIGIGIGLFYSIKTSLLHLIWLANSEGISYAFSSLLDVLRRNLGDTRGLFTLVTLTVFLTALFLLRAKEDWITPSEMISVSWERIYASTSKGGTHGLTVGAFIIIGSALISLFDNWSSLRYTPTTDILIGIIAVLFISFFTGASLGLTHGLVIGISSKDIAENKRITPNEGIWMSLRNSVTIAAVTGAFCSAMIGLFFGLVGDVNSPMFRFNMQIAIQAGLHTFAYISLIACLVWGFLAFLQHFILRFMLYVTNCLPWFVIELLDHATDRIILFRIGGAYTFKHRLLQEHLASDKNVKEICDKKFM